MELAILILSAVAVVTLIVLLTSWTSCPISAGS